MRIALLGYGKMGKMIERIAEGRGHEVVLVVDENNRADCTVAQLQKAEVAIEFTVPAVAVDDYKWCMDAGVPVVSGTTGWLERWQEVVDYCRERNGGFFYASNFSVGVNIFFRLNKYLAKMMDNFRNYKIFIEETHHIHKLDAPSGTAITLAEGILENIDRKERWTLNTAEAPTDLPIQAIREGEVPGIHEITYESEADIISIKHDAKSRAGFALGAVLAAEFTAGKKGFLGMSDMFHF